VKLSYPIDDDGL
jgi:hypothetical protein